MKRARRWAGWLVAGAGGLSGCVVKEVPVGEDAPQCRIDSDCSQRGFEDHVCVEYECVPSPSPPPDPTWLCLDEGPPEPTGEVVDVRVRVVEASDAATGRTDAKVRACGTLDFNCTRPLSGAGDGFVSVDGAGEVVFRLRDNFDGYFEVVSNVDPSSPPTFVPTLTFPSANAIVRRATHSVMALDEVTLTAIHAILDPSGAKPYDFVRSFLLASVSDCTGSPATGVSFALTTPAVQSPTTMAFYMNDSGLPNAVLTETSDRGSFGLANLTEGSVALSATINPLQRPLGDEAAGLVRPGWVISLHVSP